MCVKNEEYYTGCSDWLFIPNYVLKYTIVDIIEGIIGARIDMDKPIQEEVEALLDSWHERGWMVPDADNRRTNWEVEDE